MRFASFRSAGKDSYGVALADDKIVDVKAALVKRPENLISLIRMGDAGRALIANILNDPP